MTARTPAPAERMVTRQSALGPNDLLSHERMLDRADKRDRAEYWSARSTRGMVATAHYLATQAAAQTLTNGGNAFDAAVTAAFTLGVCEPAGSGLGGMAMLVAYDATWDRTFVVEGACRAPQDATPEAVARSSRYHGYRAVAVPTNLAVLHHLLSRYGTMKAETVLEPAIRLAEDGFPLSRLQHDNLVQYADTLRRGNAAPIFLDSQMAPPSPGTVFRQPVLAATLRRLARHGLEDFYRGAIARELVADVRENGGFLNERDLASSRLYREMPALEVPFGAGVLRSVGPPAGGVTLLQMVNLWGQVDPAVDPDTPEGAVLMAGIIRQARHDRRAFRLRTDPHGVGEAARLLTTDYAARTARRLADHPDGMPPEPVSRTRPDTPGETSHLSVMDGQGNAVALTQSIERSFGASVVTPGLGFLYNGYLRAFKVKNRRHPHFLRPGAPARSNAAPTIGFLDKKPWVALGSTGSERMASGIFQVLVRLRRQDPFAAVHAPRLHCTPEGHVLLEAGRYTAACQQALRDAGFELEPLEPYAFKMGGLQLVLKDGDGFCGVGEPRRDGAAGGPPSQL